MPVQAPPVPGQSLAPQEERILALMADGLTNKEIAAALQLSDKTVKNYIANMFQKLHISRRAQAAAFFVKPSACPLHSLPTIPPASWHHAACLHAGSSASRSARGRLRSSPAHGANASAHHQNDRRDVQRDGVLLDRPRRAVGLSVSRLYKSHALKRLLATNHTLAGRSARRRMYHGNQFSP